MCTCFGVAQKRALPCPIIMSYLYCIVVVFAPPNKGSITRASKRVYLMLLEFRIANDGV